MDYIRTYSSEAKRQMDRHAIPASITLAQGIIETGLGLVRLPKYTTITSASSVTPLGKVSVLIRGMITPMIASEATLQHEIHTKIIHYSCPLPTPDPAAHRDRTAGHRPRRDGLNGPLSGNRRELPGRVAPPHVMLSCCQAIGANPPRVP